MPPIWGLAIMCLTFREAANMFFIEDVQTQGCSGARAKRSLYINQVFT